MVFWMVLISEISKIQNIIEREDMNMRRQKLAKRICSSILAAVMTLSSFSGMEIVHAAEDEAGATGAEAVTHEIGKATTGEIQNAEDVDVYKFTTDESDAFYKLNFENINDGSSIHYEIYSDEDLLEKIGDDYFNLISTYDFVKLPANTTYYIKVFDEYVSEEVASKYKFKVTKTVDDVKDTAAEATAVAIDTEKTGVIQHNTDADVFSFTTDESNVFYQFKFENIDKESILEYQIYADANLTTEIASDWAIYPNDGSNGHIRTSDLGKLDKNTTYYVKVTGELCDGGDAVDYKFVFTSVLDDAKDTTAEATEAVVGTETAGIIQKRDIDLDIYAFHLDNTDSFYRFKLTNVSDTDVRVYYKIYSDADFTNCVGEGSSWGIAAKESSELDLARLTPNHTYYLKVTGMEGAAYKFIMTKIEDDIKDTVEEAKVFTMGEQVKCGIQNNADVDMFAFVTDGTDSFYEFTLTNISSDNVRVYYKIYSDADLTNCVGEGSSWGIAKGESSCVDFAKLTPNSTYYVKVTGLVDAKTAQYRFSVKKTQDDISDSINAAKAFAVDSKVNGGIQNNADVDYYTFTTDGSDAFYTMTMNNTSDEKCNVYFKIYSNMEMTDDAFVGEGDYWGIGKKETHITNLGKIKPYTTYYMKVWGTVNTYNFTLSKAVDDVKDTVEEAKVIALNESKTFGIQNVKDADVFAFTASGFENYTVTFANTSIDGNAYMEIYSSKECLNSQKIYNAAIGLKGSIAKDRNALKLSTSTKTYYIKVWGSATGSYKLGISAVAPKSAKVTKAGTKKVTIKWGKVSKATGYEIYRAQGKKGKYKKIKTIKKAKTVKYVDKKGLKKGKTYCYKVRAYKKVKGKTYYSAFSTVKTIKIK